MLHYDLLDAQRHGGECGLTMHPEKAKIVYCKDRSRTEAFTNVTFTFLGFQFRPRRAQTKYGRISTSFLPGVSPASLKRMRQTVRGVAAASPNVKATGRTSRAMQFHDTWLVELLRGFLSDSHAWALSISRPQACALGSAQVQDTATSQAAR